MSWDGIMLRVPVGVPLMDLPSDLKTSPIGSLKDVSDLLERAIPGCEHNDDGVVVDGKTFWIEFSYRLDGNSVLVDYLGVRSDAGPGAMPLMKRVCDLLDVSLFDCQTGEIADFDEHTEDSMNRFAEWRDRAIGQSPDYRSDEEQP